MTASRPSQEPAMSDVAAALRTKKCKACESEVPPLPAAEVQRLLAGLPNWKIAPNGKAIRREWRVRDFVTALDFFNRVGQVAEADDHHPDLHLAGYRNVAIELWTHAIGGLS